MCVLDERRDHCNAMFRSKASNVAHRLLRRKTTTIPRICSYSVAIVGSGPSGCYTAKYLPSSYQIDLIERLPTPYGLVRYGVAPDHPEVKNVQNDFDQSLPERTRLFANVTVGQDVSVQELREMYDAVVLSYGCQADRKLGVPGEELRGVLSAREFVAWYNGMCETKATRALHRMYEAPCCLIHDCPIALLVLAGIFRGQQVILTLTISAPLFPRPCTTRQRARSL
jgi:NADPH-dependent glutamate synthase beta subunit-like oxidoreductase